MDDLMIMFNGFYDEKVKMSRRETKRNIGIVMPIVKNILTYVHQRDERFKIQPLNVGSYYSHLKVSRADEFDFSVVLDTPSYVWGSAVYTPANYKFDENKQQVVKSSVSLPSPPVGKCFIPVNGIIEMWDQKKLNEGQSCLTVDDHLIPFKVKRRFKQLVSEAVIQLGIQQFVDAKRLSESPAATLSISLPNILEGYCVSVDLAPLVEAHLPFIQEFGWPRSSARWPSGSKIDQIKATGIHTVATDKLYWKFSFVSCEKQLLKEIDSNGTCRKKTQRIMKKLKESWCPKGKKQLTSYHLKNILFWECEYHPHDSDWTDDKLAIRIISMCSLLVSYIESRNLPLYFHTGVNLFASKDMDELRGVGCEILKFLLYPQKYLC